MRALRQRRERPISAHYPRNLLRAMARRRERCARAVHGEHQAPAQRWVPAPVRVRHRGGEGYAVSERQFDEGHRGSRWSGMRERRADGRHHQPFAPHRDRAHRARDRGGRHGVPISPYRAGARSPMTSSTPSSARRAAGSRRRDSSTTTCRARAAWSPHPSTLSSPSCTPISSRRRTAPPTTRRLLRCSNTPAGSGISSPSSATGTGASSARRGSSSRRYPSARTSRARTSRPVSRGTPARSPRSAGRSPRSTRSSHRPRATGADRRRLRQGVLQAPRRALPAPAAPPIPGPRRRRVPPVRRRPPTALPALARYGREQLSVARAEHADLAEAASTAQPR